MLKELSLKNFKSWKSIDKMRIAPITGLFGTNSSGKSSIFHSLLLLKQTLESSDRSLALHFGGERDYVELGSFRDAIYKHATKNSLTFGFLWELRQDLVINNPNNPDAPLLFEGREMAFSTEIISTEKKQLRVREFSYTLGKQKFSLKHKKGNQYSLPANVDFRFVRVPGRAWPLPQPFKFHGFPDQAVTYYQNSGFLPDLQQQVEDLFSRIYYLGPLREHPKRRYLWAGGEPDDVGVRGERTIDAILASYKSGSYISLGKRKRKKTLEERVAYWLRELGLIDSFRVSSIGGEETGLYEVKVKRGFQSAEVSITDVGFGVSQLLPVLVLCYYVPEGSTILLEQPELHLHPSVQMGLTDVFIDVMKNRHVQIILESHSEHLLSRLQRRMAEGGLKQQDVALYFCSAGVEGSELRPLKPDDFGNILNWPKDFFGDRFGETVAIQEAGLERMLAAEEANQ